MKRVDYFFWIGIVALLVSLPFGTNPYTLFVSIPIYAIGVLSIWYSNKTGLVKLAVTILPIVLWVVLASLNIIEMRGI